MNEKQELELLKQIILGASNWQAPPPKGKIDQNLSIEEIYKLGWERAWTHYRQSLKRIAFPTNT